MKTTSSQNASWTRRVTAAASLLLLTSCAMPPRQAWDMIQRDGLFNYWAVSSGHQPFYASRSSARPQMQSIGNVQLHPHGTGAIGYRPNHRYLGDGRFVTPSGLTYRANTVPYAPAATRYLADNSAAQPRVADVGPPRPSVSRSSNSTARRSSSSRSSRDDTPRREPRMNIPVEEPIAAAPRRTPPPINPVANTPSAAAATKPELPYGTPVSDRPNMVYSPYAKQSQLVDVAGMSAGQTVKCPYSGKLFKVPAAKSTAAPRVESKIDNQKLTAPKPESAAPKSTPPSAPAPTPKPASSAPTPAPASPAPAKPTGSAV